MRKWIQKSKYAMEISMQNVIVCWCSASQLAVLIFDSMREIEYLIVVRQLVEKQATAMQSEWREGLHKVQVPCVKSQH